MSASPNPSLADLEAAGAGLGEVTRLVSLLEPSAEHDRTVTIGLSGNVTIDTLGTYLRKQALLHGLRAEIRVGSFNDHPGNARRFAADGTEAVILLDLFDAFLPAFEARLPVLGRDGWGAQVERLRGELSVALAELRATRHVFVGLLHRLSPPAAGIASDSVDEAIAACNAAIAAEAAPFTNVHLVSTAALAAGLGWANAHDIRSYQRFRAPFTPAFLDRFAEQAFLLTRGFGSYFYKAIVLDGDNTLWGGILGEDLAAGIKLGPFGYPGSMYWQVQHELLALQQRGVLLCICSKNNPGDVDDILATHAGMVLRDEHLIAKRVNWDDKVANLESIAAELNIGLDAIVFVDDSRFECEAVRSRLPMVRTFQVPGDLSEYPQLVARIKALFPIDGTATETSSKTGQYRLLALARGERLEHASEADYLASLRIRATVRRNDATSTARIAELTQKSNQFNLTTRRYTAAEIAALMAAATADVYSIHVADKFGDSGLTGVVIIKRPSPAVASIDSFLLSCRVLGRGVEQSFWAGLFEELRGAGCEVVVAEYLPTTKNAQVRDFWDRLGLELDSEDAAGRRAYRLQLAGARIAPRPDHVEVVHVD